MSNKITFIHAADLHLDSPFKGLKRLPNHIFKDVQNSTFIALDKLVKTAILKQVDFIILVGDLFDAEKQSLQAQVRLRNAFEKLKQENITVFLSYGNHDYMNGNIHPVEYPDNVHIFPNEQISSFTFQKEEEIIARIYGFSYENKAIHDNKVSEFARIDEHIPYHIATLHGSLHTNTTHDTYAPFKVGDLTEKNMDYWALGHIHQRQILKSDPPIVYPGNTQGRHRNETGEKGCIYVEMNKSTVRTTFIPLEATQFVQITIDVSSCDHIYQLETMIVESVRSSSKTTPRLISVAFISTADELRQWEYDGSLEDMVELINESLAYQPCWNYIFHFTTEYKYSLEENNLSKGDHFAGELVRQFSDTSIKPLLKELYHHKQARKYLEIITQDDEEKIKNDAKHLLLTELFKGGGD